MPHSATPERIIGPASDFAPWDVVVIKNTETYGVSIVGEAQAGKTTLRDIITNTWDKFDPLGGALPFSTSDGFRGLSLEILQRNRADLSARVNESDFMHQVEDFKTGCDEDELTQLLDSAYQRPAHKDYLRSAAVDSVVALASSDADLRPKVNAAGARHLDAILQDPSLAGLAERPSLVVLDARNIDECNRKFTMAGVAILGTFVLTCPEEVVASRKARKNPGLNVFQEVRNLRARNMDDRNREIGRMTLPEDLEKPLYAHEVVGRPKETAWLAMMGRVAVRNPYISGIVMPTDRIGIKEEERAVEGILQGMLSGVR